MSEFSESRPELPDQRRIVECPAPLSRLISDGRGEILIHA
jgi:hypothetical protein